MRRQFGMSYHNRVRYALMGVAMLASCKSSEAPTTGGVTPPPSSPPPPAQAVLFDMQMSDSQPRNVYAVALDGSDLIQLTFDSSDHHAPSMHDSLVAFGSVREGGVVIASVEAGGSSKTPSIFGPGDAPALSPDGTTIAYLSMSGPTPRVWTARVDGSDAQRFSPADTGWEGAVEMHPVWSPMGDRIAYVSTRAGNAAIYVGAITGATGSATLLTGGASGTSVEPAWSPDGTRIVFTSNRDGPTDLYIVTVASGDVSRLTNLGNVGQPMWLPNGDIVFTQWTAGVGSLMWIDPGSPTNLHTLTTTGDAQHAAAYR